MCEEGNGSQSIFVKELNPTFLYTWKGTRTQSEDCCHSHTFIELVFVLSGKCRYRIDSVTYEAGEGDLILLNPGVRHQALAIEGNATPSTEFYVAFSDIWIRDQPENVMPLPDPDSPILHTTGELYQKLFKICASMEAENALHRQGHYYMIKSYLVQMLLLVIRERYEPVKSPMPGGWT